MTMNMFEAEYKQANENIDKTKIMLDKIKNNKKFGKQFNLISPAIKRKSVQKEYTLDEIIEMLLTKKMIMYRD